MVGSDLGIEPVGGKDGENTSCRGILTIQEEKIH